MSESTTMQPIQNVGQLMSQLWWTVLLRGILLIILGGYALYQPGMTLITFTQVLAVFVILDGILAIIAAILGVTESRGWTLVRGVLGILVGIFVLGHPLVVGMLTGLMVVMVIAIQSIVCGVMEIIVAIRERKQIEGEGWLILSGLCGIIFGGILLAAPFASSLILIRIVGAFTIFFGAALIVNSFRVRKLGRALASE